MGFRVYTYLACGLLLSILCFFVLLGSVYNDVPRYLEVEGKFFKMTRNPELLNSSVRRGIIEHTKNFVTLIFNVTHKTARNNYLHAYMFGTPSLVNNLWQTFINANFIRSWLQLGGAISYEIDSIKVIPRRRGTLIPVYVYGREILLPGYGEVDAQLVAILRPHRPSVDLPTLYEVVSLFVKPPKKGGKNEVPEKSRERESSKRKG